VPSVVLGVVVRPIVTAFIASQLDAINELDVGALVNLFGVAGRMVGNVKAEWSAGANRQGLAIQPIDQEGLLSHRAKGYAGVKVIARTVEAEVSCGGPAERHFQQSGKTHGVTAPLGIDPAHIGYLMGRSQRLQVGKREPQGTIHFSRDLKQRVS
jgi:hypothetical protein